MRSYPVVYIEILLLFALCIADIFLDVPRPNTDLHFYLLLDDIMAAPL